MNIGTGYFADPNRPNEEMTLVHLAMEGSPICGTKIPDRKIYQWCSTTIYMKYVNCDKCKEAAEPMLETYYKILRAKANKRANRKEMTI